MTTQPDPLLDLPRFAALKALPPGYDLAGRLTVESLRTLILLNLLSVPPLLIGAAFFLGVDRLLNALGVRPALDTLPTDESRLVLAFVAVVLMIAVLSFHELCHGLTFRLFGAHPRYGINLSKGVAYASARDYYLTRNAYLIVALAPLVVISIGTVILMALTGGDLRFVVGLMGSIHAGSSVGDLWFFAVCVSHPRTLLVRDFGEGAELFTRRSGS
jgi:hypothetical protein